MMDSRTKAFLKSLAGIAPRSAARESSLRYEFLIVVHAIAALAFVIWPPTAWTSGDSGVFLSIEFLVGFAASAILRARGRVTSAAVIMLVLSSHAAAFAMKAQGVASPAGGLFLISIILCGLLLGRWFVLTWTIICVGVVVWVALEESRGGTPFPRRPVTFWVGLIVVTALLMGSLARRLERAFALARGHASAMTRILALATSGARTEEAKSAALSAIAGELGADHTSLVRAGESAGRSDSAALRVPLAHGRRNLGEIVLERRSGTFSPDEVELARSLAQPVAVALLLADLAAVEREAAVLEERNRIGRDIHDSLAQGFTGVILQCQAAAAALPADVAAATAHLARARDLARASLEEARRSVWALRPSALGREGLAAAVERLAREITAGTGIAVRAEMEGAIVELPEAVDVELRGVAREAIVNAVRHAEAREIRTSVRYGPGVVAVEIGDDGRGAAAMTAASSEPGFGATSLRERVSRIGGRLTVDSRPGEGTRVRVEVPVAAS